MMNPRSLSPAGCRSCPSFRLSGRESLTAAKQIPVKGGWRSLVALFLPGVLFALGLTGLWKTDVRFAWLGEVGRYARELWIVAVSGTLATLAGVGDWVGHRRMGCRISQGERRIEFLALAGGGVPLFFLMAWASLVDSPLPFVVPILVAGTAITVLICYDEFIFHRKRCQKLETLLHRTLVFGNALAWLSWVHWIFVKGPAYHA